MKMAAFNKRRFDPRFTVKIPEGLEVTTWQEQERLYEKMFHARVWLRVNTGHLRPVPRRKAQPTPNFLRLQAE